MNQNSKLLLILERANNKLEIKKENNEYILEGIFGEIGVRNKNNRIYEESEYLAQLDELKEKIKKGKLLGELDHPQTFDISLKNVSHVIEDIYYDKENKQVKGRIRLLNTSAGKEAKALVDDGIPLHISSRAAGIVEENGRVRLKKLFTYDLVAEPGFESAELKKVNEAYGFTNDDNIQIFEINKYRNDDIDFNLEIKNNKNNQYNMEKSKYVEIDKLNEYSKYLINEISELKNEIELLKNSSKLSVNESTNFSELKEQVDNIKSYLDYIVKNLNEIFSNNKVNIQNEDVKNLIQYTNYLAENINNLIDYTNYLAENSNNIIDYTNYLAEHSNHLIAYGDSLAENLENVVKYTNYLKENIETIGEHNNYLVENINKIKKGNNINKYNIHKENKIDKIESETELYKNTITEKLNLLIESAKKYSLDNNKDLKFLDYVNESKKKEFSLLSEDEKQKLINTFKYKKYTSPDEVEKIWESVMYKNDEPLFIKNMPEEYKEAWKKASPKVKNRIIAEAQLYNLNSQYAINTFWSTRDFRDSQIKLERVNESIENTTNTYSVNSEYLAYFKNSLAKRFKKFDI